MVSKIKNWLRETDGEGVSNLGIILLFLAWMILELSLIGLILLFAKPEHGSLFMLI